MPEGLTLRRLCAAAAYRRQCARRYRPLPLQGRGRACSINSLHGLSGSFAGTDIAYTGYGAMRLP